MTTATTADAAIAALHEQLVTGARVVLGLVGAPGVGKSTFADHLVATSPVAAALFPMDGFHRRQDDLVRAGLADRKGAPETFDADAFAAALARTVAGEDVDLPRFDRTIDDPVPGALRVPGAARLIVVEGNYLLLDTPPWPRVAALLDVSWYLEVDEALRLERLVARHVAFGRTPDAAARWAASVDGPNAEVIAVSRARADLVVRR